MNKIFIVLLFILLGSSLIVVNNIKGSTENSFNIVYENNKNLALPDLNGKTEISNGLYRLYNDNGIILDYNIFTGVYRITGISTETGHVHRFPLSIVGNYTISYYYISGSISSGNVEFSRKSNESGLNVTSQNYNQDIYSTKLFSIPLYNQLDITVFNNSDYIDLSFKLQLEKGSQSTFYTVPKLITHYQDNLSMEEKQKIGLGAFGGITKIIKTINDIIKPVGDFINGLLNMF